jgi:hypothetical protein
MIGFTAPYMFIQFAVQHALGFLVFTSCIQATDLSVSLTLKSHMMSSLHHLNPFLAIILRPPIPTTRLSSIPLLPSSYPGKLESRSSTLHFRLYYCCVLYFYYFSHCFVPSSVSFYNPSASTTQKKQPLFLRRRVYWPVT